MQLTLNNITFTLLCEKALIREHDHTLILSDLHLGKATHFRKAGIHLPMDSAMKDYAQLRLLIHSKQPKQVYILGDLFHSEHNSEWDLFAATIKAFPEVKFVLVLGNHDILKHHHYSELNMVLVEDTLIEHGIAYTHAPMKKIPEGHINIAGHIHPGVELRGAARQYLTLPCFYFYENCLLLPAFGHLTGLKIMRNERGASIYAVTSSKVINVL